MCGIFGVINYGNLSWNTRLISKQLAVNSVGRGKDATGFGWVNNNYLCVAKSPVSAHHFNYKHLPKKGRTVLGHVRQATSGSPKKNYNNHPFFGENGKYILGHNGILYGDMNQFRKEFNLPKTSVETDTYIAVQFLDLFNGEITFDTLKYVSEQLSGLFVFNILDSDGNTWIVKENNPVTIIDFERLGLILYASTDVILWDAIKTLRELSTDYKERKCTVLKPDNGTILQITPTGRMFRSTFDNSHNKTWGWTTYYYGGTLMGDCYGREYEDYENYCGKGQAEKEETEDEVKRKKSEKQRKKWADMSEEEIQDVFFREYVEKGEEVFKTW